MDEKVDIVEHLNLEGSIETRGMPGKSKRVIKNNSVKEPEKELTKKIWQMQEMHSLFESEEIQESNYEEFDKYKKLSKILR